MGSDQLGGSDVPLKLREFKTLYRLLRRGWPDWAAFLFLGFLVWIEGKTIKARVKNTIDDAIEQYEKIDPPTPVVAPPVYSESGSDFFDEMRLTAPWAVQEDPSDPPQVT
jgi:hypothetical protein